jgi:predicted HAD superfamily phosphohydrolase YqeG
MNPESQITSQDFYVDMFTLYSLQKPAVDAQANLANQMLNTEGLHVVSQEAKFVAEVADWVDTLGAEKPTVEYYHVPAVYFIDHYFARRDAEYVKQVKLVEEEVGYLKESEYFKILTSETDIAQRVKQKLVGALETGRPKLLVAVPSSNHEKTNGRLQQLITWLSKEYDDFYDGGHLLVRSETKYKSHDYKTWQVDPESGLDDVTYHERFKEANSIENNKRTLKINRDVLNNVPANIDIVVLDDVTTTGSSFVVIDQLLRDQLANHKRVYVAYAKTVKGFSEEGAGTKSTPLELAKIMFDQPAETKVQQGKIAGIIFDIDNTVLATDKIYQDRAHDRELPHDQEKPTVDVQISLKPIRGIEANEFKYLKGIETLRNHVALRYVTNQGWWNVQQVLKINKIYQDLIAEDSITFDESNKYYQSSDHVITGAAKPSPKAIMQAVESIHNINPGRVLGLGNQESDIMAYRAAGVEPYLVTIFNKVPLDNTFGLDEAHVIDSQQKLDAFVQMVVENAAD